MNWKNQKTLVQHQHDTAATTDTGVAETTPKMLEHNNQQMDSVASSIANRLIIRTYTLGYECILTSNLQGQICVVGDQLQHLFVHCIVDRVSIDPDNLIPDLQQ